MKLWKWISASFCVSSACQWKSIGEIWGHKRIISFGKKIVFLIASGFQENKTSSLALINKALHLLRILKERILSASIRTLSNRKLFTHDYVTGVIRNKRSIFPDALVHTRLR
jgi:hypothetical protein